MFINVIKLIRVKHWIKNLLVFFPFIFAGELFEKAGQAALAFLAFSFVASAVYIINDIRDVDADRRHPKKKNRPIASGAVTTRVASGVAAVLFLGAIAITVFVAFDPVASSAILITYCLMNIAYSFGLKNVPIIDIAVVSIGFLLRVLYGGTVGSIEVSPWLFLTVLSLAFYFALGKRRGELMNIGVCSRKSLKGYTESFLEKNMSVFLGCGLVFYSLWCVDKAQEAAQFGVAYVISVPIAMLVCMRYSLVIEEDGSDGDPVNVVLSDKILLAMILVWALIALFLATFGIS